MAHFSIELNDIRVETNLTCDKAQSNNHNLDANFFKIVIRCTYFLRISIRGREWHGCLVSAK
jgi:hypothetical protein